MTQYARIEDDIVVELISATTSISTMFTPTFVATLVECDNMPGVAVGWTYSGGAFSAPAVQVSNPAQQAAAQYATIIASGLTVTSQTGGLMGVFGISSIPNAAGDSNTSEINAEVAFINNFGEFTNGTASGLVWPLLNGQTTTFSSTGQFLAFAKASAQYVAACKLAAASLAAGQTPTWPNANIEIP